MSRSTRISRGNAHDLSLLCRARRAAAAAPPSRARQTRRRRAAAAERREGDLPPGRPALVRQSLSAAASRKPPDGNLFVSLGDHYGPRDEAQNLGNHLGKIVRITPDGAAPRDNPFIGRDGAKPEIWSYGHRNPQSLAIHPATGKLWEIEHGPRGGDEVNIPEKGKNYGWPVIGYGVDYSGAKIHEGTHKDGMEQPIKYWVPSIAPCGMAFYTGDLFPKWRGSLFTGSINRIKGLVRLTLDGEKVTGEERLLENLQRADPRRAARAPTARCGCSPTTSPAASCASRRRGSSRSASSKLFELTLRPLLAQLELLDLAGAGQRHRLDANQWRGVLCGARCSRM